MLYLIPLAIAAALYGAGRWARRSDRPWFSDVLLVLLVIGVLLVLTIIDTSRDAGVSDGDFAAGMIVGGIGLGIVPILGFYSLGYANLGPLLTGVLLVGSVIAYAFYVILLVLYVAGLVACAPG